MEQLREDDEFILYDGRTDEARPTSILLLGPVSAHPTLQTLKNTR
jgi:hypothetical protein